MSDVPLVSEDRKLTEGAFALEDLHAALSEFWQKGEVQVPALPPAPWREEFDTALGEIVANVMKHACPPGAVRLALRLFHDRVEALLWDDGRPYTPRPQADRPSLDELADSLAEGGYGLQIARAALDQLEYTRGHDETNQWRLVKHRS